MKKINAITTRTLRNAEFLGLFSEGLKQAKTITDMEAQQAIAAYEVAVNNLAGFLETSINESTERIASQLNAKRNTVFASCRMVARASQNYPDSEKARICAKIWKVFEESPNPRHLNQAQATGAILNVIHAIRDLGDESLEAVGFKIWIDSLADANDKFVEADMARFTERGQRELELGKKLRSACYEAFSIVAAAATLKAASGSKSSIAFIDSMNATIDAKKQQVKSRSKAHPKSCADSGSSNTGETAANGEVIAQPASHNSVTARVGYAA